MNWAETCSIIAITTNSPLPVVWRMTLGQIVRYSNAINAVTPLFNPFAKARKEEIIRTPDAIRSWAKSMNIKGAI